MRSSSPSPLSLNPNQPMMNSNFNLVENSPGQNSSDFDPYKSIIMPSTGNLNSAFNNSNSNNINNFNEGFQGEMINNTMNLNISEIKHKAENESANYPEFHQLNRDSISSMSHPVNTNSNAGFNFNNAMNVNNFDANFNDFNDAQNFNNQNNTFNMQPQKHNNFPDKEEFDF